MVREKGNPLMTDMGAGTAISLHGDRGVSSGKPRLMARELRIQLFHGRNWLVLLLPGLVGVFVGLLVAVFGGSGSETVGTGFTFHPSASGLAYPFIALNVERYFILPLVVAIFAGEALAGEASWGSLRYILAGPVRRRKLFAVKTVFSACEALVAIVILSGLSLVTGVITSGSRPLQVFSTGAIESGGIRSVQVSFSGMHALGVLAGGTGLIALSMVSTFAFALFLSTFTNQPFVPVAGGVGLLMVSRAIANIPGLALLTPLLPTAYGIHWADVLSAAGPGGRVVDLCIVQIIWCTALVTMALWRFSRRDMAW